MLTLRRTLASCLCAGAMFALAAQAQSTAFTYQGLLQFSGGPVVGSFDFKFELFAVASGSVPLATNLSTLPVSDGLFTATLDFGNQFPSASRWLQISVRPSGGGAYTVLTPRQPITPAPYAIGLALPYAGTAANVGNALAVSNTAGAALAGTNTNSSNVLNAGVVGISTASGGNGVTGIAENGAGAYGVYGKAIMGTGVRAISTSGSALWGNSTDGVGVRGGSVTDVGVVGESTARAGVRGINHGSLNPPDAGVVGESDSQDGNGVAGFANHGSAAYAIYGEALDGGWAGYFQGKAHVNGVLSKSSGSFKIDHPLDPGNKYLSHSFVESPDMMNVYNGLITTDESGYAIVTLPAWFQTLNRDFRYQLTIIDEADGEDFVQAKVVSGVKDNQFMLRTSAPQTKVSWQITGIRQDPWANAHRIQVEELKTTIERGLYLHPELYGESAEAGMQTVKARAAALNPPVVAPTQVLPEKEAGEQGASQSR